VKAVPLRSRRAIAWRSAARCAVGGYSGIGAVQPNGRGADASLSAGVGQAAAVLQRPRWSALMHACLSIGTLTAGIF